LSDTSALNDDVRRSPRRSTGAIDNHCATQHEPFEGANAPVTRRGRLYLPQTLFGEASDHFFANFNRFYGRVHAISRFNRPLRAFDIH
jgi:hypothetical protein